MIGINLSINVPVSKTGIHNDLIDTSNQKEIIKTEDTTSPNFLAKASNFLGSNKGQAVTGLVGAGLNITSNLITAKNMSKT